MLNLLTNAFKFTQYGEVGFHIETATDGWNPDSQSLSQAPGIVCFSVSDTGIGIDADHHARIFEEFAQGDGSTSRVYGGTGLGLSISREYVRLLGGEITLDSQPGSGSTFRVFLPAAPVAPSAARSPALTRGGPDAILSTNRPPDYPMPSPRVSQNLGDELDGVRVLVVDDDIRNVFALTALLERCGATVAHAESGFAAVEIVASDAEFQLVLMDIMMPKMDGYETIRIIRQAEIGAPMPIIAVTGKAVPGERERCLAAGADDYIPKPVNSGELLAAIEPWLPKPAGTLT
jgi:CheY-like chemotaxis protein